ncbi:MAG TPA: STAS domain-containing protein [Anaerolineales bacterium]|nr:STAS domain-containing protein [Anaerolineales bacterium]
MDKLSIQFENKAIPPDEDGSLLKENALVVTASGHIDSETAPAFDAKLTEAVDASSYVVINLKGVDYMSSAGLRALVKAVQAAQNKGGAVKLAAVPEEINSVMYTVGLNQKMAVFTSVDEAVASFW